MDEKIQTTGPLLAEILSLETKVWQALCDGDPAADAKLLTTDFLGVYPSGYSDRTGHCDQLQDGPTVTSFSLSEARLRIISPDAVLLTYTARYQRPEANRPACMFISSLWERAGSGWRNSFSQDTPAD